MGSDSFATHKEGLAFAPDPFYWGIQICVAIFLIWIIFQLWDRYRVLSTGSGKLPPGGFGWPLIGETIPFVSNGRQYFKTRVAKYGNIFTSHLVGRPIVVICGSESIKQVLNGEHTIVHNNVPPGAACLLGPGSLSCTRDVRMHKSKQKAFRMTFTHDFMNQCMSPMQDIFRSQMTSWIRRGYANGVDDVRKMTLLVGSKVLLGFDIDGEETTKLLKLFRICDEYFFSLPINLPGTGFRKALQARKELVVMIKEHLIQGAHQSSSKSENVYDIWTSQDILLPNENEGEMSKNPTGESDAIDMIMETLFASQSTIASACCSMLVHLALAPTVVDAIRAELLQKWPNSSNCQDFKKLLELTYVNDVVKEVLRVSPPVAGGFRETKEPLSLEGFHIPKGWGILYCITDTHENADTFNKEERPQFKPERWEYQRKTMQCNGNIKHLEKFEYLPFGGGGRRCVGKEFALLFLRLFIVEMCRSCDWKLQKGDVMPEMKTSPIPFPADGMPLCIKKAEL